MPGEPLRILYDADCGFCRWSLARLLRLDRDGRLLPVAFGSAEGRELLAGLPPERRLRSAHVAAPDGRLWSGGDALAPVAGALGGRRTAAFARALALPARLGYRAVAANRGPLGRLVAPSARDRAAREIEAHGRRVAARA